MAKSSFQFPKLREHYSRWASVIEYLARQYALLVAGIIQRESAWNEKAERYEPAFYDRYLKENDEWQRRNEQNGWQICHVASSWGLLQIMFVTAWERGYRGDPVGLLIPEVNLVYGTKHLAWLLDRYEGVTGLEDMVAAYNAGNVRLNDAGQYVNWQYVDFVFRAANELKTIFGQRTYGRL